MPNVVGNGSMLRAAHPFFSAETASAVLFSVERILPPKAEPIPLSTDMPMSPTLKLICTAAVELAEELYNDRVEPLHLLAAEYHSNSSRVLRF